MKPRIKLGEALMPDGTAMALYEHDGDFAINIGGQELMHSRASASELLLGEVGMRIQRDSAHTKVLIGGLGLGFTLKSVLEASSDETTVEVAEIVQEVIDWNRTFLSDLNGKQIDDPRVSLRLDDVTPIIRNAEPQTYDVILLDIDNGPVAMVAAANASLYSKSGLRSVYSALKPGGRAVFWSAGTDVPFERRLAGTQFRTSKVPAKAHHGAKRAAHLLYVADRPDV